MQFRLKAILVLVFFLDFMSVARAESAKKLDKVGPHGGTVWLVSEVELEIAPDATKKVLNLYLLKPPKKAAEAVRLRSQGGKEIILKLADPWHGLPHYKTVLGSPSNLYLGTGSFKGLEIEFEFGK